MEQTLCTTARIEWAPARLPDQRLNRQALILSFLHVTGARFEATLGLYRK